MSEYIMSARSNTARGTGSPLSGSPGGMNECNVEFMRHEAKGNPEIVGIINCFGCAPEASLEKCFASINTIMEAGVDTILVSACMMPVCRFKKALMETMKATLPEMEMGKGTFDKPLIVPVHLFTQTMKRIFTQLAIHRTYFAR